MPARTRLWIRALLAFLPLSLQATDLSAPGDLPASYDLGDGKIFRYVIGGDDRITVTSNERPWRLVGKVSLPDGGHCTGSLVGRDLVLTNAHCVLDDTGALKKGEYEFLPGFRFGRRGWASGVSWIWHGTAGGKADWALLRLNAPLGDVGGYLGDKLPDPDAMTGEGWRKKLVLVGYSGDRYSTTPGAHIGCSVTANDPRFGLAHDCDSFRGASGSPLLARFADEWFIVGLHWGGGAAFASNFAAHPGGYSKTIGLLRENEEGKPASSRFLHVCNRSRSQTVSVAVAYPEDRAYRSVGWFNVTRDACEEIAIPGRLEGPVYVHATDGARTWGRDAHFCVHGRVFSHANDGSGCGGGRQAVFTRTGVSPGVVNQYGLNEVAR